MGAALITNRYEPNIYLARSDSRESAIPIPPRAWVKSAPPPTASNDVWYWARRAHSHRSAALPSTAAESAGRLDPGRDLRREAHRAARVTRIDHEERLALFLAGALLGLLAWGAMGAAPRSAAVMIAIFAGAFSVVALVAALRRWDQPRIARVIDVTRRTLPHANAALDVTPGFDRSRPPFGASRPIECTNGTRPTVGTPSAPRGRSAYAGLADEQANERYLPGRLS